MTRRPTSGDWRAGILRRSTADWPFDWVADITSVNQTTHDRAFVATVRQSGAREFDEALANLKLMARAPAMLRLVEHVVDALDMSDPDHPAFADSAADCLDALLVHDASLRALLAEFHADRRFAPTAS